MPHPALFVADLIAVAVLTFGLYFPRHRRRDLLVAFLGVNVGVLAVSSALSTSTVGAGLGLGLFGVLSIIRLRSTELDQHEVAYYFSALALGLLGGLDGVDAGLGIGLMALIVAVMFVGDHPRLFPRSEHQVMVLDEAITDRTALRSRLEQLLSTPDGPVTVHEVTVQKVDLVNDTTLVDVRFRRPAEQAASSASGATSEHGRRSAAGSSAITGPRTPARTTGDTLAGAR